MFFGKVVENIKRIIIFVLSNRNQRSVQKQNFNYMRLKQRTDASRKLYDSENIWNFGLYEEPNLKVTTRSSQWKWKLKWHHWLSVKKHIKKNKRLQYVFDSGVWDEFVSLNWQIGRNSSIVSYLAASTSAGTVSVETSKTNNHLRLFQTLENFNIYCKK